MQVCCRPRMGAITWLLVMHLLSRCALVFFRFVLERLKVSEHVSKLKLHESVTD